MVPFLAGTALVVPFNAGAKGRSASLLLSKRSKCCVYTFPAAVVLGHLARYEGPHGAHEELAVVARHDRPAIGQPRADARVNLIVLIVSVQQRHEVRHERGMVAPPARSLEPTCAARAN